MNGSAAIHYRVWEGTITNLQVRATHVHFLKSIKHQQKVAGGVAIAQAALHETGAVFSAQAESDEGDPVQGFVMQLNGKHVHGSFWNATFKEGDYLQVIGEEQNGMIHAIAVTKPDERVIWMQPHCVRGLKASAKSILKKASIATALLLAFSFPLSSFMDEPLWFSFISMLSISGLIWGVMVLWSWSDFMAFAREMTAVGAALGLPEPEKIDLFKATKQAKLKGKPDLPLGVYYY